MSKSMFCKRCGSLLTESGFCSGYKDANTPGVLVELVHMPGKKVRCPFGRHLQTCQAGWYGHPSHPNYKEDPNFDEAETCRCPD